ncbi:fumarylacetoacetate hydrolase family protein [Acetobacteroides hydrogenigenes]|uniref:2-keto-4-pentenoate hydratase/2-oxohepta-3-ene-1,7-dioic acid hydratase in catechol pathway n=1 Tax=Acetobacteroides hydrogenigenes TaxID=979970 RepID=A0A4R2EV58_9BACT|nr:fumarylacetoacetate hydrolase family protein [Acetobacteroides hydrogenigenes]TCN72892.1 2-keto-4-pentenoate hydratase/2-oxohepta-3-ene-1,7-dioic acid hydratase in catechol pathway [Acetobacteroides hydrogenigenes]
MKIICIGRNYVDHAKELNNPVPEEPVFFMKPDTALLRNNAPFFYPSFSKDIHHEVELIIKINKVGRCIGEKFANRYYSEVGLGIDFTARDVQQRCKEKGLPWEVAKAFDFSAPISSKFLPISDFESVDRIPFRLVKNGEVVQQGNSGDMLFSVNRIISYVSQYVTLKIGDLIYTGTPAGVGSVAIGDRLQGYIADTLMFDFEVK